MIRDGFIDRFSEWKPGKLFEHRKILFYIYSRMNKFLDTKDNLIAVLVFYRGRVIKPALFHTYRT